MKRLVLFFLVASAVVPVAIAQAPAKDPCAAPEALQFDFWIGDWDVFGPAGKQAGTNRIERRDGAMVLSDSTVPGRKPGAPVNEVKWSAAPDGTVRQVWRVSPDGGKTWNTVFDGRYVRSSRAQPAR